MNEIKILTYANSEEEWLPCDYVEITMTNEMVNNYLNAYKLIKDVDYKNTPINYIALDFPSNLLKYYSSESEEDLCPKGFIVSSFESLDELIPLDIKIYFSTMKIYKNGIIYICSYDRNLSEICSNELNLIKILNG